MPATPSAKSFPITTESATNILRQPAPTLPANLPLPGAVEKLFRHINPVRPVFASRPTPAAARRGDDLGDLGQRNAGPARMTISRAGSSPDASRGRLGECAAVRAALVGHGRAGLLGCDRRGLYLGLGTPASGSGLRLGPDRHDHPPTVPGASPAARGRHRQAAEPAGLRSGRCQPAGAVGNGSRNSSLLPFGSSL